MAPMRMPPGTYKKVLVRLPPDILAWLQAEAAAEHRSVNGQLVHVLSTQAPKSVQAPERTRRTTPATP